MFYDHISVLILFYRMRLMTFSPLVAIKSSMYRRY